jgi:hypothetical protein
MTAGKNPDVEKILLKLLAYLGGILFSVLSQKLLLWCGWDSMGPEAKLLD